MKKSFLYGLIFLCTHLFAQTNTNWIIQKIDIQGLQGISKETVLSYLPVQIGDRFTSNQSSTIIQSLYKTNFFSKIQLFQEGNTLIIRVIQRPIISRIQINGNKEIPTDKLLETLKSLGFSEGKIFDQSLLEKIQVSLSREYFTIGKYQVNIQTNLIHKERNRIEVQINITEGKTAKIKQIKILGCHSFSEKTLLKLFSLSTSHIFSFFTNKDQYSREKLEADLETLRSYYMDRGYIKFNIDSAQVSISPDRSQIYIMIKITEGALYHLSGYSFKGKTILTSTKLDKLAQLHIGSTFSRRDLMDANQRIALALGDEGYADSSIRIEPKFNDIDKTVWVTLNINPGKRIYIHQISFIDNFRTNDETFRRELLQREGSLWSSSNLEKSKRNLLLLPFVKNVDVSTHPVANKPDQIDVHYKVTESSPASIRAGIGYSQLNKFMINAGFTHNNVLGTGNSLSLNLSHSHPATSLDLSYYNPYYTSSGTGRSIEAYASRFNAEKANITDYATNDYGFMINYHFPLSLYQSFQIGWGYENTLLNVGNFPSQQLQQFINQFHKHFYNLKVNAGWIYQGLNKSLFPTQGLKQIFSISGSVPINTDSLEYYKSSYSIIYYHPLPLNLIGQLKGYVGYGDGYGKYEHLPFFKNFYEGGVGSVRGYEGNTLGPRDSNGRPIGGNFAANATIGIIFPNPVGDNLRTTWFFDGGNAYQGVKLNNLRYSTGIQLDWLSPIGLLNFSLAKPLNAKPGDEKEIFQFNIGASF